MLQMDLSTYSGLKAAIADYLNRDDLTSVIPAFIALAEAKFNRKLRARQMVKRATATIDSQYFAYPADWLEAKEFILNTNPITYMQFATESQANELKASTIVSAGKPSYYTIIGSQIEVIAQPDTSYTGQLTYYAKIPSLSDSNTSNWLLAYAPDLYLYGALLESAPYLKDDDRLAIWGQMYSDSKADIELADQRASVSSTPVVRARSLG
jgi:hypothetical protein